MGLDQLMVLAAEAAAAACALFVIVLSKRRREILLVLIGASAGLELQVAKIHLATLLTAVLVLTNRPGGRGHRRGALVTIACSGLLAVTALLGPLTINRLLAVQLLLLAATAGALMLWCTKDDLPFLLGGLLAGVSLGSAIAVLQNVHLVPASYFLDTSGIPRVHSLYREPDFLAAFAAIGVVLSYRLVRRRWAQLLLLAVNGVALVYTFARAAWLALLVSVVAAVVIGWLRGRVASKRSNVAVGLLLVAVAAGIFVGDSSLRTTVMARIQGLTQTSVNDYSVEARQRQLAGLSHLADTAPWYGDGLSAEGRISGFGRFESLDSASSVASNWLLGWWVDGKYLAIPLIGLFLTVAYRRGQTIAGQCLILVLVNSLFSNVMFFPVTWVLLAAALISPAGRRRLPDADEDERVAVGGDQPGRGRR